MWITMGGGGHEKSTSIHTPCIVKWCTRGRGGGQICPKIGPHGFKDDRIVQHQLPVIEPGEVERNSRPIVYMNPVHNNRVHSKEF